MEVRPGDEFRVWFPFVRETVSLLEPDGAGGPCFVERESWRPGVRNVAVAPDDCESHADGEGEQVLTVVSIHKPGLRYPPRVFYVQEWVDPERKRFGKKKLRMTTLAAFRRKLFGYIHPVAVVAGKRREVA